MLNSLLFEVNSLFTPDVIGSMKLIKHNICQKNIWLILQLGAITLGQIIFGFQLADLMNIIEKQNKVNESVKIRVRVFYYC